MSCDWKTYGRLSGACPALLLDSHGWTCPIILPPPLPFSFLTFPVKFHITPYSFFLSFLSWIYFVIFSLPGYRANRSSNESLGLLLLLHQFGHVIFFSPNIEQQQQPGGIQLPVASVRSCVNQSQSFPFFLSFFVFLNPLAGDWSRADVSLCSPPPSSI